MNKCSCRIRVLCAVKDSIRNSAKQRNYQQNTFICISTGNLRLSKEFHGVRIFPQKKIPSILMRRRNENQFIIQGSTIR